MERRCRLITDAYLYASNHLKVYPDEATSDVVQSPSPPSVQSKEDVDDVDVAPMELCDQQIPSIHSFPNGVVCQSCKIAQKEFMVRCKCGFWCRDDFKKEEHIKKGCYHPHQSIKTLSPSSYTSSSSSHSSSTSHSTSSSSSLSSTSHLLSAHSSSPSSSSHSTSSPSSPSPPSPYPLLYNLSNTSGIIEVPLRFDGALHKKYQRKAFREKLCTMNDSFGLGKCFKKSSSYSMKRITRYFRYLGVPFVVGAGVKSTGICPDGGYLCSINGLTTYNSWNKTFTCQDHMPNMCHSDVVSTVVMKEVAAHFWKHKKVPEKFDYQIFESNVADEGRDRGE
jgi:hypothetical protein